MSRTKNCGNCGWSIKSNVKINDARQREGFLFCHKKQDFVDISEICMLYCGCETVRYRLRLRIRIAQQVPYKDLHKYKKYFED